MDPATNAVFSGVSPRPLGAPSPLGSEGGRRSFSEQLSGALPSLSPVGAPSPHAGGGGGPRLQTQKAQKAAELLDSYAAVFVQKMMDAMHKTTFQEGDGFPHGGRGEQVFQGWMDQETSQKLAKSLSFRKHFAKSLQRMDRQAGAGIQESSSTTSRTAGDRTIPPAGGPASWTS